MRVWVLTLFPEMFQGPMTESIIKRSTQAGIVEFRFINFRDYATDRHRTVDDTPYGGGDGMVLKPEPIFAAVDAVASEIGHRPYTILTSPQGESFHQSVAEELSKEQDLLFICGHYEGFDDRILSLADRELSLGDYVLTGGELAAMVMIDATVRLLPGVLGGEKSAQNESFVDPLLDFPQYTKPVEFRGMSVPEVLTSGHHARIEQWRREQSLLRTAERRPDLIRQAKLTPAEQEFLRRNGHSATPCDATDSVV